MTRFPARLRRLATRFHPLGLAALLLLVAGSAGAAPFCLPVPGGKPLCIYDDAAACDARAQQQSRQSCSINPAEITVPSTGEEYCSIDSQRIIQCLYPSFNACRANIRGDSAFCFPRTANGRGQTEPDRPVVP